MKIREVREYDDKKLRDRLADARGKLLKLMFGVSNREVKNIREIRRVKRDISRILTVLRERSVNQNLITHETRE